jgi:beta-lactamase class A
MGFAAFERRLISTPGRVGVVVEDEEGALLYERNSDDVFPAASVIKLPLVMALYAEVAAGRVELDERVAVRDRVDGSGVLRYLRGVDDLSLRDHATLAIIVSDNTATNRLIDRLGVDVVNNYLDRWGCPRTRLRRAMYDLRAKTGGIENVITPREAARLLRRLLRGELVDRATSDVVLAILRANQDDARLRRYLPSGTWAGTKSGSLEGVRHDVGVIRAERAVAVAGFAMELPSEAAGEDLLALLGWCAYRSAGGVGEELPAALV